MDLFLRWGAHNGWRSKRAIAGALIWIFHTSCESWRDDMKLSNHLGLFFPSFEKACLRVPIFLLKAFLRWDYRGLKDVYELSQVFLLRLSLTGTSGTKKETIGEFLCGAQGFLRP